ncbi:DUF1572 domain-containing protein [Winogradskyella sp. DF17]|uniref:DUF1572 domain-containing protein n=1 Tax=Winogradskyella pelagia TaxID=2819984 RepID=A0ABS3T156_9FLAO|nr:DUF1572 domain-containing protein [Winogradskyella sp. DF17]MBO3116468.1 DUF1572 domain-containing protein [Winogradskyella sp. DF17]
MTTSQQLSKHIEQAYFGGNWAEVNVKDTISKINIDVANHKIQGFNTILALSFHIHYFIKGVAQVFKGESLDIRDKFSYQHPKITNQKEWEQLQQSMWQEAKEFVDLIVNFPNSKWNTFFTDEKYGSYYSNILGLIEHTHYHLGQIVVLNKMIEASK